MSKDKIYGVADKAWQVVAGCSPAMPCAPRCWARKTVARIVECQTPRPEKGYAGNPERAEFFKIALTPDGQKWSGQVFLDNSHLMDPLKWRKPALIATGFHGDWGRLDDADKNRMLAVMVACPQHTFMPLTKQPDQVLSWAKSATDHQRGPLPNMTIGCSVMNQPEADKMRPAMAALSVMGWNTHCWYEPALGPVDWTGWEFLGGMIVGGESGAGARPFVDCWAYTALDWCRNHGVPFWMKQMGSDPVNSAGESRRRLFVDGDTKGKELASLPDLLQVRELPILR